MKGDGRNAAEAARGEETGQRLPRWEELPDIELYMDQVLILVERYLGSMSGPDGRNLTASMVNNYVKQGVMPPPVRKKYGKIHLAYLLMICCLKAAIPIAAIRTLLEKQLADMPLEKVYAGFRGLFEKTARDVSARGEETAEGELDPIFGAALRSGAEQALAMSLYRRKFGEAEEKNGTKADGR